MTAPESFLSRLRSLDREATPGPWMHFDNDPGTAGPGVHRGWIAAGPGSVVIADLITDDGALIVALRNALPEIIEAFELLTEIPSPAAEDWRKRIDAVLSKVSGT